MTVKVLKWLSLALVVLSFAACDGKKGNRKLVEAAEVHQDMMSRYDSIYHALIEKREEINQRMGGLNTEQQSANESMLRSIDKSLNILQGWNESVVGVPGHEFEYHDHHDHADHEDDHNHHHVRDNDNLLRGMSDEEVLDLQKALRTRLNEVSQEINTLLETIKMYEQREN